MMRPALIGPLALILAAVPLAIAVGADGFYLRRPLAGLAGVFDTTPDDFTFTAVTDAAVGDYVTSNAVTISGLGGPATATLSGADEYSLVVDNVDTAATQAQLINGSHLAIRLRASTEFLTARTATVTIGSYATGFTVTTGDNSKASCRAWKLAGSNSDGVYLIDPDGPGGVESFQAYCDQGSDGGGWMRVMQSDTTGNFNLPLGADAVGDVTVSGAAAKLSDAQITAGQNANTVFKVKTSSTGAAYYARRLTAGWNNTQRAFGWGATNREQCQAGSYAGCGWQWTSHAKIDTADTGLVGNDCNRIFTDYGGVPDCYSGRGGRCFSTGGNCGGHPPVQSTVWMKNYGPPDLETSMATCAAWYAAGYQDDGFYLVDPDGSGGLAPYVAMCAQSIDGGGWMRIFQSETGYPYRLSLATGAAGDFQDWASQAKLSDAAVNAARTGATIFRLQHGSSGLAYLVRNWSAAYDTGATAFGIGGNSRQECTAASTGSCGWLSTSYGIIDNTAVSSGGNDCNRYFVDYLGNQTCYQHAFTNIGGRCVNGGASCANHSAQYSVMYMR